MKKPKKITVKFFLNKNLNPLSIEQRWYPLYTQITYDRKNTQIKCTYGWFYENLEHLRQEEPHLLVFEEKILKRAVEYDLAKQGDSFQLKGMGKKYDHYSLSIHALFNSYLKLRLKEVLKKASPQKFLDVLHTERPKTDFFVLYEACLRLFENLKDLISPDFTEEMEIYRTYYQLYESAVLNEDKKYLFPVVMDWLDGSHPKILAQKLNEIYQNDLTKIEKSLKIIDKIIQTKLEIL